MLRKRVQNLRLTIPSGTVANRNNVSDPITTDKNFKKVKGIQITEVTGSAQDYRLGLVKTGSGSGNIIDLIHKKQMVAETSVPVDQRIITLDEEAGGQQYAISWEVATTLSTDVVLDIAFILDERA
jgi:hypothetical protein